MLALSKVLILHCHLEQTLNIVLYLLGSSYSWSRSQLYSLIMQVLSYLVVQYQFCIYEHSGLHDPTTRVRLKAHREPWAAKIVSMEVPLSLDLQCPRFQVIVKDDSGQNILIASRDPLVKPSQHSRSLPQPKPTWVPRAWLWSTGSTIVGS